MSKVSQLLENLGTLTPSRKKSMCVHYKDGNCMSGAELVNGSISIGDTCHSINLCLTYVKKGKTASGFRTDAPLLNGPIE